MPFLPLSSFSRPARLLLILTLFLLIQALRKLAGSFWIDAAIEGLVAPLLFFVVIGWQVQRRTLARRPLLGIPLGAGIGLLFFLLLFFTKDQDVGDAVPLGISLLRTAFVVPVVEEIYFRWVLTGTFKQSGLSDSWTVVLGALFFAFTHDYSVAPFLFPVGLAAGWLFLRFGMISSLSMHAVYNLAILLYSIKA